MSDKAFESWAILELMGHRRLAGYVREVELAGAGLLRIDIPARSGETAVTQFYAPSAMYGLTPVSEEVARAVAESIAPSPVTALELALPTARRYHAFVGEEDGCGLCGQERDVWQHRDPDALEEPDEVDDDDPLGIDR